MLTALLVLLGPAAQAEPADPVALLVARTQAALEVDDPEAAAATASAALAAGPEDWRAWWGWHAALDDLGAQEQLRQEAAALSASADPWQHWVGQVWTAVSAQRVPATAPGLPGAAPLAATAALAQGRATAALALVESEPGPEAQSLVLQAHVALGDDRQAVSVARAVQRAWPDRPELVVPICGVSGRGAAGVRRAAVSQAAAALGDSDVLAVYRAHALLSRCDETALALAASARLVALGEPHALGGRHPWGRAMVRDLGRVLAMQSAPAVPAGGTPAESQRVLVATARELQERGRQDDSLTLWRRALALCEPPPVMALEGAQVELDRGDPDRALALAAQARRRLSLTAVDPGEQGRHARLLAETWRVEALVLRGRRGAPGALEAAALAASTAGRAQDLVLWGELLEQAGEPRAALQAYSRAAAQGHRGLEPRLERLYDGPLSAETVVASWRVSLDQDPRSHAVQEARGARLPSRTLATTAGPLRIGDPEGEWLVVNFWASWCGPCQRELPELALLAEAVEAEGLPVRILAVSLDDRRGDYERWIADRETAGLVLAWDPDLGRALHLRSIPTTLVVDPQGLVQQTRRGYKPGDGERLLEELRPHLEPATEE